PVPVALCEGEGGMRIASAKLWRGFRSLSFGALVSLGLAQAVAAAPMFVPLGDLAGGSFNSQAWGVSTDGSTAVGVGTTAAGQEAFRWTSGGGMVGLGFLPGHTQSGANRVSADGSTVVGASRASSVEEAFRWTSGGGMVGLGFLPGGSAPSIGFGVS